MGGNLLKGLRVTVVPKSILAGIIVVKYIAMPVIGIGVVKGSSWLGLVHDDPLYKFMLLLHFALPPAMNIGKLIQQVMFLFSHQPSFVFYYHFYSS